jgi:hypothetical protein
LSTFYNDLKEFADDIKRQFDIIINDYSDLVYSPEESHPGVVMIPRGDYCWKELSEEGKQLQSKLNSDYDQFASMFKTSSKVDMLSRRFSFFNPFSCL